MPELHLVGLLYIIDKILVLAEKLPYIWRIKTLPNLHIASRPVPKIRTLQKAIYILCNVHT